MEKKKGIVSYGLPTYKKVQQWVAHRKAKVCEFFILFRIGTENSKICPQDKTILVCSYKLLAYVVNGRVIYEHTSKV